MTPYGYLDLAGILFSLAGIAFVTEPYTETDALWVGMIIAGFLMWGVHAWPRRGRANLPVRFPAYTPRFVLVYGASAWGLLAVLATLICVWGGVGSILEAILPVAAIITAWRAFSLYAWRLVVPHSDMMRA